MGHEDNEHQTYWRNEKLHFKSIHHWLCVCSVWVDLLMELFRLFWLNLTYQSLQERPPGHTTHPLYQIIESINFRTSPDQKQCYVELLPKKSVFSEVSFKEFRMQIDWKIWTRNISLSYETICSGILYWPLWELLSGTKHSLFAWQMQTKACRIQTKMVHLYGCELRTKTETKYHNLAQLPKWLRPPCLEIILNWPILMF